GNGRTLPHQIEVRVGLETFATLTVSDFVFADGSKSKPADTPPNPKVESDATGANTEPHATTTES
ncbi:MAG: hypothetical protein VB878_01430, partial [Pirellulaceae bacterium]